MGAPTAEELRHNVRRMGGRDPHEDHRAATTLELLFDLTFVAAFAVAASKLAHAMAEGHIGPGLLGFGFASFAICWAWINFSWFASAYDTDDWVFRLVTMIQMAGVLVLAIGLPALFASIESGSRFDNAIMVLGYVIMRIAMIFQWLRAAKQDPARRRTCLTYAKAIAIAQVGWVLQIFTDFSMGVSFLLAIVLVVVEMLGPFLAERKDGGTPWHAHHIAERYGLFMIIALGEGIVGTVATMSAVIEEQGWSLDAGFVCFAGVALTFGMWWIYFMLPGGHVLHRHRERSFVWGYGQMVVAASIVATGAGLHAAAYFIEEKSKIGPLETLLCVVTPVFVYLSSIYLLYYYMIRSFDNFHVWLFLATVVIVAIATAAAISGLSMPACLLILTLAPAVTIIGYEWRGHRHQAAALSSDL